MRFMLYFIYFYRSINFLCVLSKSFKGGGEKRKLCWKKTPKCHFVYCCFLRFSLPRFFPCHNSLIYLAICKGDESGEIKKYESLLLRYPNLFRMCQYCAMLYDIFIAVSACLITAFVKQGGERTREMCV